MSETITGALIALAGVVVAGILQWLQELWKARNKRRETELAKRQSWQEELNYARTIKALVNTQFTPKYLEQWDEADQEVREQLFKKLANLEWHAARLHKADLSGMLLNKIFMPAVDLTEAKLDGITLSNAFMPEAIFTKASFGPIQKTMMDGKKQQWGASLFNSFFRRADFSEVDLTNADLTHADFSNAELWSAKLVGADLSHAKFNNANLYEANLHKATIIGTDFTGATLGKANLKGAKFDDFSLHSLKSTNGLAEAFLDDELREKVILA